MKDISDKLPLYLGFFEFAQNIGHQGRFLNFYINDSHKVGWSEDIYYQHIPTVRI
jgi:hypothetical protein